MPSPELWPALKEALGTLVGDDDGDLRSPVFDAISLARPEDAPQNSGLPAVWTVPAGESIGTDQQSSSVRLYDIRFAVVVCYAGTGEWAGEFPADQGNASMDRLHERIVEVLTGLRVADHAISYLGAEPLDPDPEEGLVWAQLNFSSRRSIQRSTSRLRSMVE